MTVKAIFEKVRKEREISRFLTFCTSHTSWGKRKMNSQVLLQERPVEKGQPEFGCAVCPRNNATMRECGGHCDLGRVTWRREQLGPRVITQSVIHSRMNPGDT